MWQYPKSPLHQAAIDAQKPERDRETAKSLAAQKKQVRERDNAKALLEHEAERLTILAKTQRLRAERLAREAVAPTKKITKSSLKRRAQPAIKS